MVPDGYTGEPEIDQSLDWVWNAFWCLDSCRSIGMAAGRIPWTAVSQYAREQAELTDPDDIDDFWFLIDVMDREYLKPKPTDGGAS